MEVKSPIYWLLGSVAVVCLSAACEKPITEAEAAAYVESWAQAVPASLDIAGKADRPAMLKKALEHHTKMEALAGGGATVVGPTVQSAYSALDYQPQLVDEGASNPSGDWVLDAIQSLPDHAADAPTELIEEIRQKKAALEALGAESDPTALHPNAAEKQLAIAYLTATTHDAFPLEPEGYAALTDHVVNTGDGRLHKEVEERKERQQKKALAAMDLEAALAMGLGQFGARTAGNAERTFFVHARIDDVYNDPEIRKRRPDKAKGPYMADYIWRQAIRRAQELATRSDHRQERLSGWLQHYLQTPTAERKPILEALWPKHPQYQALVQERRRYRKLVDEGGWPKVPVRKRLRVGQRDSAVPTLRKRLAAEGYLPASNEPTDLFDKALKAAITTYQTTHQMKADGKPHHVFWKSLNVPADRRLAQIDLNLKRWRESNLNHDEDDSYVFVNVPDFHLEVWRDHKRTQRIGIVVGNNDIVEDEELEESFYANRTPISVAAYIDRAIYNPFWNVTPRIRQEEVVPEVRSQLLESYRKALAIPDPPPPVLAEGEKKKKPSKAEIKAAKLKRESETLTKLREAAGTMPEEEFSSKFPYFSREVGDLDVNTTDPDNIPSWYEANKYEVMHAGKKWEYVRMTPGEHNALGLVKIIFPNPHDVYFHDTNAKALFSRELRAFSHGCMRLSKPLEFAEHLLDHDGLYEARRVKKNLSTGDYDAIFLKRKVPVVIEYYTVRVDQEGRANFLADIYGYDRAGWVRGPVERKVQK